MVSPPRSPEDAWAHRISRAIVAGDGVALAELFERRFDSLVAMVRARTRCDQSFALDCAQDTFVRVAERLPPLASLAALDAWLTRTALRCALDRLRSEAARARRDCHAARARGADDAPQSQATAEELAALEAALAPEPRALLRLRHAVGLTVAQMAQHLGLGEDAVESRLRRAMQAARAAVTNPSQEHST